jgi:hypothetical protein
MTFHQKIFAILASIVLLGLIFEFVRKKKLKEEYSWLWILTGVTILVLVVWYDSLLFVSRLIGAVTPITTLFLFGLLFLVLINIHFSIRISTFTDQIKELSQRLAMLTKEVKDLTGKKKK